MLSSTTAASAKFPKRERICSKDDIALLFSGDNEARMGKGFDDQPSGRARSGKIAARWAVRRSETGLPPVMVLISVPKRNLKRAADRNRVKRLMREVYRTHPARREHLNPGSGNVLLLALIYTGRRLPAFDEVKSDYHRAVGKINFGKCFVKKEKCSEILRPKKGEEGGALD